MLETLAQEGFRQLQAQYIQCWLHTNQQVLGPFMQLELICCH